MPAGPKKKAEHPRVALMGSGIWGVKVLEALLKKKYSLPAVICEPAELSGSESIDAERWKRAGLFGSLKEFAEKSGVKIFSSDLLDDPSFVEQLKSLKVDIFISASFHKIVPGHFLSNFMCINGHTAPLPRYRGRTSLSWAILNGEKKFGITAHLMTEEIDSGPILHQKLFPLSGKETIKDLLFKSLKYYPEVILEALSKISSRSFEPEIQNPRGYSYFPKLREMDARIDWKKDTKDIFNLIRAECAPYPGAHTFWKGKKVIIESAGLPVKRQRISPISGVIFARGPGRSVKITTGDGHLLIQEIEMGKYAGPPFPHIKPGSRFE